MKTKNPKAKAKPKALVRAQSFNRQLRQLVDDYKNETGSKSINVDIVSSWMLTSGKFSLAPVDQRKILAKMISRAMREDYIDDDDGQPVRHRHAYKIVQGDQQLTFWVNMEDATRNQMRLCFSQRRRSVLKDCEQLDRDRKHYNKKYNPGEQLEIDFDFRPDMHEQELPTDYVDVPPEDNDESSADPKKPR